MQEPDDAALVARSASGDTGAFEVLVGRHQRVLFGVAFRMLGDYERRPGRHAVGLHSRRTRSSRTFDPRFRFFSWIYRILLNECLNAQSRSASSAKTLRSGSSGRGQSISKRHRSRRVGAEAGAAGCCLALPVDYRQVIVLRALRRARLRRHRGDVGYPGERPSSHGSIRHGNDCFDLLARRERSNGRHCAKRHRQSGDDERGIETFTSPDIGAGSMRFLTN